jgi:DNA-binding NarL/FixJ family response regulator
MHARQTMRRRVRSRLRVVTFRRVDALQPWMLATAERRPIRVVVADDHDIVRAGIRGLLAAVADIEVVGVAADGDEAVEVTADRDPDVVLMDLQMPRVDGIEATRRITRPSGGSSCVLVLTSFSDHARVTEAQVLRRVAAGAPNKRIALELGISSKTVKTHLTHVFRHIGVRDRMHAARWAQRHGLAPAESGPPSRRTKGPL